MCDTIRPCDGTIRYDESIQDTICFSFSSLSATWPISIRLTKIASSKTHAPKQKVLRSRSVHRVLLRYTRIQYSSSIAMWLVRVPYTLLFACLCGTPQAASRAGNDAGTHTHTRGNDEAQAHTGVLADSSGGVGLRTCASCQLSACKAPPIAAGRCCWERAASAHALISCIQVHVCACDAMHMQGCSMRFCCCYNRTCSNILQQGQACVYT